MRSSVIAAMIAATMTRGRRAAPWGGTVISGAVVTAALFANLGGGVNVGHVVPDRRGWGAFVRDDTEIAAACRVCDPASCPLPELNATLAVLLHELIQSNHGRHRNFTIFRVFPRDQRAAGSACLRRHSVRLS